MLGFFSFLAFAIGAILVLVAKSGATGLWLPLFWIAAGGALLALHVTNPVGWPGRRVP